MIYSQALRGTVIALGVVLVLVMLGGPDRAAAQDDPTPSAHITVQVSSGEVSWSDPDDCSSDYHIYRTSGTDHYLLGSADSGSTEATVEIPGVGLVRLYCGEYDPESSENDLVAYTGYSRYNGASGTYSSAPLTALSISSGTLSPTFDRGIFAYAAEVASDVSVITLDPTALSGYQLEFLENPSWLIARGCSTCPYFYYASRLYDADRETPGFQINLDRGKNQFGFGVTRGRYDPAFSGTLYRLTVTVQNSPATGQPTIRDTAKIGQTLTADVSGISDADGLANVTYSYQWLSSRDTEIAGATSSTYTVAATDVGETIKVRVSFTDDAGYDETLTSEATAAVSPNVAATGAPVIMGTVEVGETLTGDTSGIKDEDGLDNVYFSYQWIRSDGTTDWNIGGATGVTYAITATDVDYAIKLRVSFADDKGGVESLTSSATVTVPIEVAFTFNIEGTTVTCDDYNVHAVNRPYKECDDPTSTEQRASGEIGVEIEIARSVSSQLYKFDLNIHVMEDDIGHINSGGANDLCLGPGLADSVSMEVTPNDGTGPFTYTDDGTIFELCPAGTYQLYVPWYRYNYTDQEYEYAGTFRRYFFITSDGEVDESIEKVKFIRALYSDPPVSHGDVKIVGTKESTVLNRELTTFSLSIDGLVPQGNRILLGKDLE